ncbi:hypothetical protein ACSQ67_013399 [Phaseolus vulgaris]
MNITKIEQPSQQTCINMSRNSLSTQIVMDDGFDDGNQASYPPYTPPKTLTAFLIPSAIHCPYPLFIFIPNGYGFKA